MAYTTINKSTDYFNTKLYDGSNSSPLAITGVGFKPDWTWVKHRNGTSNHKTSDIVRGVTKALQPNDVDAEATDSGGITSFDSDGFTVGNHADYNSGGRTYASWNWLAGGSQGSSNTDGSINTTYTSVNTTAGFSISSYTGTGSNATVGHGLGAVPKMIIVKNLSDSDNWVVYHQSLGNTDGLYLNTNDSTVGTNTFWNNTTPTTNLFSVGTHNRVNGSGDNMIAYCFADVTGYSKFGSYIGNNNADGPFIYTGFKPAFVLVKPISGTESWTMYDNKRIGYNPTNYQLYPNLDSSEATVSELDVVSNGFKIRSQTGRLNNDGVTMIYMAFAEAPLVGSNGVTAKAR